MLFDNMFCMNTIKEDKMKKYIKELNEEQRKAALQTEGPVLVLAGAGSGKTKTVISRTLHILESEKAKSDNILIMTFTNKAAREMKERAQSMLKNYSMPLFTTFHSWGVRFIKSLSGEVLERYNLNLNFNILDSSEQEKLIDNLKFTVFDKTFAQEFSSSKFLLSLSNIQNNFTRSDSVEHAIEDITKLIEEENFDIYSPDFVTEEYIAQIANLFCMYKEDIRKNNSVDFDDLINLPICIMNDFREIRVNISKKYKYIMVDEFQDTNGSQFRLLELLLSENKQKNICVVGDDSQSIYGWRGAKISYILNFHKHFKECKTINLSKNYRSKMEIVKRANKLLTKSKERHKDKKELVANSKEIGFVKAYQFCNDFEEAGFVARQIKSLIMRGATPGGITILYRSFYVARQIESELIKNRVKYNIHNGKTLLERVFSRAFIAYLKVIHNHKNSLAILMFLEFSGILTKNRASDIYNSLEDQNMYDFLKSESYEKIPRLPRKTKDKLKEFIAELDLFRDMSFESFKNEFINNNILLLLTLEDSKSSSQSKKEKALSNLNLFSILSDILKQYNNLDSLLETLSLEGEVDDSIEDMVNLMTIHASKGLEFNNVFLIGASHGVFPSEKTENIEEERRLFYVAITRAKSSLVITSAKKYGKANNEMPISVFVDNAKIETKDLCKKRKFY